MALNGKEVVPNEHMPLVLLNPEIEIGPEKEIAAEGCLSFPEIFADITRPDVVDVKAMNHEGNTIEFRCSGLLARAYLLQWSWGIKNFSWYTWDSAVGSPLSESDLVTPTTAGLAYARVGDWLRGSRMLARSHAANGTWTITGVFVAVGVGVAVSGGGGTSGRWIG